MVIIIPLCNLQITWIYLSINLFVNRNIKPHDSKMAPVEYRIWLILVMFISYGIKVVFFFVKQKCWQHLHLPKKR